MKQLNHKSFYIILCSIIIGLIIYLAWLFPLQKKYRVHHVNIHGIYLLHPIEINQFELTDFHGNKLTKESLKNHWSMLFFGFTQCGMVCPVTLSSLNQFYQSINKKLSPQDKPQIIFITIDPERDTLKKLNHYLSGFNPNFIGARASKTQTTLIEKQFHIQADNLNDHSADILLVNPNAEIEAYFYFPHNPTLLEKDYLAILKHHTTA